mgnify:CR=1 FL=1
MAEQTVKVRVTQDDIDAGVRDDCNLCPVALAAMRAVPQAKMAAVTYADVRLVMGASQIVTAKLPDRAILAIVEFDSSGAMEPFEFDLPLPIEPEVAASVEGEGHE